MLATFPHRRVPPSDSQALLCGPARLSAAFSVFDNLFIKTPKSNGCQACCPPPPPTGQLWIRRVPGAALQPCVTEGCKRVLGQGDGGCQPRPAGLTCGTRATALGEAWGEQVPVPTSAPAEGAPS